MIDSRGGEKGVLCEVEISNGKPCRLMICGTGQPIRVKAREAVALLYARLKGRTMVSRELVCPSTREGGGNSPQVA